MLLLVLAAPAALAQATDALLLQATDLATSGAWADALPVLDRVLSTHPDQPQALYYRALCRLKLGELAGADEDLERYEGIVTSPTDQELGAALRVQLDAALAHDPASQPPEPPRRKVGPELPLLLLGGAAAGLGAGFVANGLVRANRGIEERDRGSYDDGRVPYNLGIGLLAGGGATMVIAIPAGLAFHKPGRAHASVSISGFGSPQGVSLGVGLTW